MFKTRHVAILAVVAALAACSDGAVSPTRDVAPPPNVQGGPANAALTMDTAYFSFTVSPYWTMVYNLGAGNTLTFPKGALCDLSSSYGPTQWNQPCTPSTQNVTIAVKAWLDAGGQPHVDFNPSVRFVPSLDPTRWVVLSFADARAAQDPAFNINYCPSPTATCYNEALTDPDLATVRDPVTGHLIRRIKHFSGYNVAAGFTDATSMNRLSAPTLSTLRSNLMFSQATSIHRAKRSGFMLASGDK